MKFLFVGDPHNQVRTPANRTDDFHETYKNKVKEIKELAVKENVEAIIQAGDFFHTPQYNNDFIMDVIDTWSLVPEKYKLLEDLRKGNGNPQDIVKRLQEDIQYIGPIGNHDLIGESLTSYPKTSLAFLEKLGFMQIPSKDEPIMYEMKDGTTVAITATSYHHGMDEPEYVDDYIVEEKLGDIHIHVVHGYLAHTSLGDFITHTLVDSIKETKADLTLAGHDHIGFAPVEIDGKLFVNPGALTRTKADVKEITRKPKVLVIEIKDKKVHLKEHYLKSAPDGEKVLDRTSILAKESRSSQIESIKSIVNKAELSKGQSVTDIIESIAEADDIDNKITSDVVKQVTGKIEEMGASDVAETGDYHLSQIVLENFQSHKHSVFDLSEGLNIFTGESSNGKSAVMRGMRWLMDNHGRSQRESFIRHGADYAKVTAVFSNGIMVSRIINEKAHRDNGWEIYDPKTGETETGNTRMIDEVRGLFGYTKIQYDTNEDLDINFLNQGDGWYFIGDDITASKRAKVIGAIFGTHYTDAVMRDLERNIRQDRQEYQLREKDLEKVNKDINDYSYINDVEHLVNSSKVLIDELIELNEKKETINTLLIKTERLNADKKAINQVIEDTKEINQAKEKLAELETINNKHQYIEDNLILRSKVLSDGRESRLLLDSLNELDKVKESLHILEKSQATYSSLLNILEEAEGLKVEGHKEKLLIEKYESMSIQLQLEYKELLDEHEVCPTCGQSIDSHILEEHLAHA